jgi:hypothetical protein
MQAGGCFVFWLLLMPRTTDQSEQYVPTAHHYSFANFTATEMNTLRLPKLTKSGVACGLISGFPVHDHYPIDDRTKLDKLFTEDYFAWQAMARALRSFAATGHCQKSTSVSLGVVSVYFLDGSWEYKGHELADHGFLLVGPSRLLKDFMQRYQQPFVLKAEDQTNAMFLFSAPSSEPEIVFVGDPQNLREILSRTYSHLRREPVFGAYTPISIADSTPQSILSMVPDFLSHIRQNGQVKPNWNGSITIGEGNRRELELFFNHPRIGDWKLTNPPTLGGVFDLLTASPRPPRALIDAAEARNHCREHLRVRGAVTEIEVNRRGDVILGFGSGQEVFRAVIPASCVLSRDEEWINSLKNGTLIVSGLISFYAQGPALRILEKNQVALAEE